MNKRETGSRYEDKAASFLLGKGLLLIEKNYRCRMGEIDLIMQDGKYLVFVEVKYRASNVCGIGQDHVDKRKQKTIALVARQYLCSKKLADPYCRFDVVAIDGNGSVTHIENAFES